MIVLRHELGSVPDEDLAFAVSVARMNGKYVFCRHRDRSTWECPGGHIEPGETPLAAAKRELYEETGALEAEVHPVCIYSVEGPDRPRNYGLLCRAVIHRCGPLPEGTEIAEARDFEQLPQQWTYPAIVPRLLEYAG